MTRCKRGKIKTTSPISSKQCSLACWNLCLDLPLRWKLLPSSPLWLDRKYNKTCTCTNRFCSWEAFYVFTPWTYDKYDRVGAPPQAQAKAWAWGGAVINTLPPTAPRPHPPSHAKRGRSLLRKNEAFTVFATLVGLQVQQNLYLYKSVLLVRSF